ncbi:MAG: FitA-like ribbon-helix-helix domain-containing protein, partial [Nevskiaceae bacterium]
MSQISIRNVDAKTAAKLKRNAQKRGQSLNRYLNSLLHETAEGELPASRAPRHDLDSLAGTWS